MALIAPRGDERTAARLASEIAAEMENDPVVRVGVAEWRAGDDVHSMVARAQEDLLQEGVGEGSPASTTT